MIGEAHVASVELARRRVKRAAGLLREATADLVAARPEDVDTVGVFRATSTADLEQLAALVRVGLEAHGELDVVVLARPSRASHHGSRNGSEGAAAHARHDRPRG